MPIQMLGSRVGVEKLGKAENTKTFLVMPDDGDAVGIIKYLGESVSNPNLTVGTKVFYGKDRHTVKMNGQDILVMDEENVYAIAEEKNEESKEEPTSKAI